jgi:predicted RNA-binding protein
MCDVNVYYHKNGQEELLMESVEKVIPNDTKVVLENIYGQRVTVKGRIKEVSLFHQRIIIERLLSKEMNAGQDTDDIYDEDDMENFLKPAIGS